MRNKKQTNLFSLGGKIIIALIFVFIIVGALRVWQNRLWDGKSRLTIALNTDPVTVFSIEPATSYAVILTIPANTIFEVPYGYGAYMASSIYRLGELDDKRRRGELFSRSTEDSLRILIDSYLVVKKGNFSFPIKTADDIKVFKNNNFSLIKLPLLFWESLNPNKSFESNLSLLDLLTLFFKIRSLRSDQIDLISVAQTEVLKDKKLPDGTDVKTIDDEIFDFVLDDAFVDMSIRKEFTSLEVVNATDKDKLATQIAKVLKNLGVNVVSKATAAKTESFACKLQILNSSASKSKVLNKIKDHYHCQVENSFNTNKPGETDTADIRLVLGEGFIK